MKSRSRAYPSIDLREATVIVQRLVAGGFEEGDRDAIAQALGWGNGSSGGPARRIAALAHFGYLSRREANYRLTELGRQVGSSQDQETLRPMLRRAFESPPLFREILETYRRDGAVPRHLAHALQEHGVTEAVKYEVAKIFMASAEYSGVLAADGVFREEVADANPAQATAPSSEQTLPGSDAPQGTEPKLDSLPQHLRFYVTDRKLVDMRFPAGLNDEDLDMIKKQIEFLEMQVRLSRPTSALPFRQRAERATRPRRLVRDGD